MPNRDETGPEGKGQKTGQGLGSCEGGKPAGRPPRKATGRRPRRGTGRGLGRRA